MLSDYLGNIPIFSYNVKVRMTMNGQIIDINIKVGI